MRWVAPGALREEGGGNSEPREEKDFLIQTAIQLLIANWCCQSFRLAQFFF
jgi:hypothetical protein